MLKRQASPKNLKTDECSSAFHPSIMEAHAFIPRIEETFMLLRHWLPALLASLTLAGTSFAQPAKDLEARLRTLEKEIAAVRGLEFKAPVQAKIIPRGKEDK